MQLPARLQDPNRPRGLSQNITSGLAGLAPPYVSINGGQFTLVLADGEALPLRSVTLDCVILDALEKTSRVFWGVNDRNQVLVPDPNNPRAPVCFSDNGVGASGNAQEPQSASCMGCRWNEWAWPAAGGGTKPACTSTKKLAIYVAQHPKHPFLLRVPVTSHKNLGNYGHSFAGQQFETYDLWTRITIEPQAMGYTLTFDPAYKFDQSKGFTDDATSVLCVGWIKDRLTDQLVGRGDPVWTGQARQEALRAPEAPAPLPPPRETAPSAPAPFQMPAAPAATTSPPPPAQPEAPAQGRRRRGAQTQQDTAAPQPPAANGGPRPAPFGIASGPAAPPPSDMEAALAKAFGLPSK